MRKIYTTNQLNIIMIMVLKCADLCSIKIPEVNSGNLKGSLQSKDVFNDKDEHHFMQYNFFFSLAQIGIFTW